MRSETLGENEGTGRMSADKKDMQSTRSTGFQFRSPAFLPGEEDSCPDGACWRRSWALVRTGSSGRPAEQSRPVAPSASLKRIEGRLNFSGMR